MQLRGLTHSSFLCSLGGEQFIQFTMTPTKSKDDVYLYEELVEPVLKAGERCPSCRALGLLLWHGDCSEQECQINMLDSTK